MNRLPTWAFLAIGIPLIALSMMGLIFSVHTSAKVFYAALLMAGVGSLVTGYRRQKAATHQ
jgi:hypothetical protein